MRYRRTYEMLKTYGHTPYKAAEIVLDAARGDAYALAWVRAVWSGRHGRVR